MKETYYYAIILKTVIRSHQNQKNKNTFILQNITFEWISNCMKPRVRAFIVKKTNYFSLVFDVLSHFEKIIHFCEMFQLVS